MNATTTIRFAHGIEIGDDSVVRVKDRHGTRHELVRVGGAHNLTLRCILRDGRFVFEGGLQGEHSLDAGHLNTDATRLLAHWQGYCQNNGCGAWEVVAIELSGDRMYPFHVTVINHYDGGRKVEWTVPDLKGESYDLSRVTVPEVRS